MPRTSAGLVRNFGFAVAAVTTTALPAYAHEDEGPDPRAAEASAPGYAALGLIAVGVLATVVWFQLRRRAMLRAIRQPSRPDRNT